MPNFTQNTQTLLLYGIIFSTLLIIVLVIILYRQLSKVAAQSQSLELQKEEIEAQRDALLIAAESFDKAQEKIAAQNKKINEALDTFLYRVSHDIRGPLATMMGLCYVIRMDRNAPIEVYQDFFEKIDFLTKKMNRVLLKVANVSKVNYKSIEYQKIDIQELLNRVLTDLEILDNFDRNQFQIEFCTPIQDFYSDVTLLEIILTSLLENTIHHINPYSEVPPYTQICIEKNASEEVVFTVKSNSIPISEAVQEKLFNMFYRATNLSQGAGLGLYIARVATEKLEGRIELAYSNEVETAFMVRIPNKNFYYKYE
ncbi:MAG: HAMP domain-containing histidine kinase [Microscillaceae bacterium]|nr:HAMP domain-containing histidine kinase [Microscillaceae bacterium]MDW8460173.1 HAMP domain-containing sensor histidine kinase [Cytophagales bacterium]